MGVSLEYPDMARLSVAMPTLVGWHDVDLYRNHCASGAGRLHAMKYSVIRYGSQRAFHPAFSRITYSQSEHKQATAEFRRQGWFIH